MDQHKFSLTMRVRYQDIDSRLLTTPQALLGYMQEAAVTQAQSLDRGFGWLAYRNYAWMIVHTMLEAGRLPEWRSELTIQTWPSEMGRLLSRREFTISDQHGLCAQASTLWAFMDTQKRSVTRVPRELADSYSVLEEQAISGRFSRPLKLSQSTPAESWLVRRSDIDSNGHVNNLRYLNWIFDSLPERLAKRIQFSKLNIRYQKETLPGQRIQARCEQIQSDEGDFCFAHEVLLARTGDRVASAQTVFQKC